MARLPVKVEPLQLESGEYALQVEWTGSHSVGLKIANYPDLMSAQTSASQLFNFMWRVFDAGKTEKDKRQIQPEPTSPEQRREAPTSQSARRRGINRRDP